MIHAHPTRVDQEIHQHFFRDRWLAAVSLQDAVAFELPEHLARVRAVDRQDAETHVFQHLGEHPSEAQHDDRPELRVVEQTDDDLDPLRHHLLDFDAVDPGRRMSHPRRRHDAVKAVANFVRCPDVQDHAADIRLVQDVWRSDLQRDRESDLRRQARRLISGGCRSRPRRLKPVLPIHSTIHSSSLIR